MGRSYRGRRDRLPLLPWLECRHARLSFLILRWQRVLFDQSTLARMILTRRSSQESLFRRWMPVTERARLCRFHKAKRLKETATQFWPLIRYAPLFLTTPAERIYATAAPICIIINNSKIALFHHQCPLDPQGALLQVFLQDPASGSVLSSGFHFPDVILPRVWRQRRLKLLCSFLHFPEIREGNPLQLFLCWFECLFHFYSVVA